MYTWILNCIEEEVIDNEKNLNAPVQRREGFCKHGVRIYYSRRVFTGGAVHMI